MNDKQLILQMQKDIKELQEKVAKLIELSLDIPIEEEE